MKNEQSEQNYNDPEFDAKQCADALKSFANAILEVTASKQPIDPIVLAEALENIADLLRYMKAWLERSPEGTAQTGGTQGELFERG
jgi:hypothetical protein